MSEVVTRVLGPWVRLRVIFTRLDRILDGALEGTVPLMSEKMVRVYVEDAKKFFETLAVYVGALSTAAQPTPIKPSQVPVGTEYDDVKDFLFDFASTEAGFRFYDKKASLAIVALLGEALITGELTVETVKQLSPLVKSILKVAVEQTSSNFDEVHVEGV